MSTEKVKDEKFNKIKDLYVKLREDHINLLRQKAEVDKKLTIGNRQLQELEQNKSDGEEKIKSLELHWLQREEDIKESWKGTAEELDNLKKDKVLFNMETEVYFKMIIIVFFS